MVDVNYKNYNELAESMTMNRYNPGSGMVEFIFDKDLNPGASSTTMESAGDGEFVK